MFVICSEIPYTQIPRHMAASQFNYDKSQTTGFLKCKTIEQGISEQTPVIKVNNSELKLNSNDGKTHAEHSWKSSTKVS